MATLNDPTQINGVDAFNTMNTNNNNDDQSVASNTSHLVDSLFVNHNNKNNNHTNTSNNRRHSIAVAPHRWDGFVRKGTKLKSLLQDTMLEVKTSMIHQKRQRETDDDNENEPPKRRDVSGFAADLAREKTIRVNQLQRELKDAEVQASTLQTANTTLREETAVSQSRLDRTVEALKIAGANAAKARADADAAEATAATLAQTLQSLQAVITETKRASQILHQEQAQVKAVAAAAETKLLQKEGDLARAQKELQSLRQSHEEYETTKDSWKTQVERLQSELTDQTREIADLKRQRDEQTALERARKERADKIEHEYRTAQAMLVEATAGQSGAQEVQANLQETIERLKASNETLHEQIKEQQTTSTAEKQTLADSLAKAEKESQTLRIKNEALGEELQRAKLDKVAADKQILALKSKLLKAERNLAHATTTVTPEGPTTETVTGLTFSLPPLMGTATKSTMAATAKENEGVLTGHNCCLCFKAAYGMMKTCQCGNSHCKKRAHNLCVKQVHAPPSVSHPGTPAPLLPIVLCGHTTSSSKS